jgi:hypothetical protein
MRLGRWLKRRRRRQRYGPKIRTVAAFIRLDRSPYQGQIAETLTKLRQAKAAFERAGYDVQTIRITTQLPPVSGKKAGERTEI